MAEIKSTRNYEIFKMSEENRPIAPSHVAQLMHSISRINMLKERPIIVNSEMVVIDGQHRLEAAKRMGVEVFYEIRESVQLSDMIHMNISRSWQMIDYLNYYIKQGNREYIKFQEFINKNGLNVSNGLNLLFKGRYGDYTIFRLGEFVFPDVQEMEHALSTLRHTIDLLASLKGKNEPYYKSARFTSAVLTLAKFPNFNSEKWIYNLGKLYMRVVHCVSKPDYLKVFVEIYNFRNSDPIGSLDL